MLVLLGVFLGLVFLLGGISGAFSHVRNGRQSKRIRRRGVTVDAEVLRSRALSGHQGDVASGVLIAGQWQWGHQNYKGEFTVPGEWWEEREGTSIAVRIDPNRPHVAEVPGESSSPLWTWALAVAWLFMAAVGIFFLFRSAVYACDPVQYDFLEPMCQSVRAFT